MVESVTYPWSKFAVAGQALDCERFGSGLINDTYLVRFPDDDYVLQRINHEVFRNPKQVMENIARVCEHLKSKQVRCLEVVPTHSGDLVHEDEDGNFWRMYRRVAPVQSYDRIERPEQAYHVGLEFGRFQGYLSDLHAHRLHNTIPNFHHTPSRYARLMQVADADPKGRRAEVAAELDFVRARERDAARLVEMHLEGSIPERITHNDTKLNNLLFDEAGARAICVVDLDTVMPGLIHYDFGDMVRTATCYTAEDETDLGRVNACLETFEHLARGYHEGAHDFLLPAEVEQLAFSGVLMTLEVGIRFLTDYLEGDVYFKVRHSKHNLQRARCQFALVRSLESRMDQMQAIVARLWRNGKA